jgi:hypothetical protein
MFHSACSGRRGPGKRVPASYRKQAVIADRIYPLVAFCEQWIGNFDKLRAVNRTNTSCIVETI